MSKNNKHLQAERERESLCRSLIKLLTNSGYQVRREKLKQGFGWKVQSGVCKALDQKLIFVDSRMAKDEQVAFLISKIVSLGLSLAQEDLNDIPEKYHQALGFAAAA